MVDFSTVAATDVTNWLPCGGELGGFEVKGMGKAEHEMGGVKDEIGGAE